MRRTLILVFSFVLALLFAGNVHAQASHKVHTGIQGTVLDANGKPVKAAAIMCNSSAGIRARIVHTDSRGHYLITGLKQDSYDLRASADGAYSDWEKNIPLRTGQTKEVTLRLLNGNTALGGILPSKQKK
jgi:hypothetical protein